MVIFCAVQLFALPLFAAPKSPAVPESEVSAIRQAGDDSPDIKLQQQKLDLLMERLELQEQRIGVLAFYLAGFSVFMTVIGVVFGFRFVRKTLRAGKASARKEFEEQTEAIISTRLDEERQKRMAEQVDSSIRPELAQALEELRKTKSYVLGGLAQRKAQQDLASRTVVGDIPLTAEQIETLDKAAKALEFKLPREYLFEDWFVLGVHAFGVEKYEVAADNFTRAEKITSDPLLNAIALGFKGLAYARLSRFSEAIALYDTVIMLYGDMPDILIREVVAKAILNKGLAYREANQLVDELAVYDDMLKRYGGATEAALQKMVAKALVNKCIRLGQNNRNVEAIDVCDEVVRRYGDAEQVELREQVVNALLNKGSMFGKMGRKDDEAAVYDVIIQRYSDAEEPELRNAVKQAIANFRLLNKK
jgi:tetratricopeptide (TPR) repeat protein